MITHFFTHKDFLPGPESVPGTLYSPLQIIVEMIFLMMIIFGALWISKRKKYIRPVFKTIFFTLIIFEVLIDIWDSMAGLHRGFDFSISLPLYPCSIFMFVLPFIIWGKELEKKMACGYVCTLGLIGAGINFLYPATRLADYSCISFPSFHTFFYHGSMLFVALVVLASGMYSLCDFKSWKEPFLASVPGLIFSIPANLMNFSAIGSDYMYFTGQHELAGKILQGNINLYLVMSVMYLFYIFGPVIMHWISYEFMRLAVLLNTKNLGTMIGVDEYADRLSVYEIGSLSE